MTKQDQTKWIKPKSFNHKAYFNYLHNSNQVCVVCGSPYIEIHHISDVNRIKGERRSDKRIVTLCKNHHKDSKFGIHIMSKEEFYDNVMSLEELLHHSKRLLIEFEERE